MTVQQFLTITSSTPPPALRQAMAALAVEPTHQQDAFSRFYDRVLDELDLAGEPHSGPSSSSSRTRRSELAAQVARGEGTPALGGHLLPGPLF